MSNPLSELIARGEGGYGSYNRGRAGDANGATIDFSQMTLGELQRRQDLPRNDPDRLFAIGKYQIIPSTMDAAVTSLRLDPNQRVTPELQERIFSDYLISRKQPGIRAYITGEPGATLHNAQRQMAGEWASVADPDTGLSRYGSVGNNRASISAEAVGTALTQMRANYQAAIAQGQTPDQAWRTVTAVDTRAQTTTTPTNPLADGSLSRNERGEPVRQLQRNLNELGFKDERGQALETNSGVYGAHTAASVRSFQQANRLPETGVADRATLAAVEAQVRLPEAQRNHPGQTTAAQTPTPQTTTPQTQTPQTNGHWPAPGNTTINRADKPGEGHGEFGTSRGGGTRSHMGVDIVGREGDPIQAYGPGTVHVQRNNGSAGNTVTIDHGNGVVTRYMHLQNINVQEGQRVEGGAQIGTMGRTGNTPRQGDTHLHFEYRVNGRAVDPMPHLNVPGRDQTTTTPTPANRDAMADGVLRQGERGNDVRGLQQSLNQLGIRDERGQPLETRSGIYGEHTAGAVRNFQRAHQIEPTGIADQRTLEAIGKLLPEGRVTAQAEVQSPVPGTRNASPQPANTPPGTPAAPSPTPNTPPAPREGATGPLISDAAHPNHALYTTIGRQMPGARPEAIANVTLQAMENGMTRPDQIGTVWKHGNDVLVQGTTPGFHVRVDTQAPTAPLQQMSDHMAKQSQSQDQDREHRQQLATPGR